jgi:TRAP-type C4-dicarboxylate transport system permease large subunit
VLGLTLAVLVWWRYRDQDMSRVRRASGREIGKAFLISLPATALPFIIRAAVIQGVATATEVSTIGIAHTVLAGLPVYRRFDCKRIYPMLVDTASLSGSILLSIGAATGMAWALTQSGFSGLLAEFLPGCE